MHHGMHSLAAVMDDPTMGHSHLALLAAILRLSTPQGECFVTNRQLAAAIRLKPRRVYDLLAELVRAGHCEHQKVDGRRVLVAVAPGNPLHNGGSPLQQAGNSLPSRSCNPLRPIGKSLHQERIELRQTGKSLPGSCIPLHSPINKNSLSLSPSSEREGANLDLSTGTNTNANANDSRETPAESSAFREAKDRFRSWVRSVPQAMNLESAALALIATHGTKPEDRALLIDQVCLAVETAILAGKASSPGYLRGILNNLKHEGSPGSSLWRDEIRVADPNARPSANSASIPVNHHSHHSRNNPNNNPHQPPKSRPSRFVAETTQEELDLYAQIYAEYEQSKGAAK